MNGKIDRILENMIDTNDPKVGSVFEKMVKTGFAEFDVFMKTVYPMSESDTAIEGKVSMVLYYDGEKGHVGTFNHQEKIGYFGGSRIGSQNLWLKQGDPLLKDHFHFKHPLERL